MSVCVCVLVWAPQLAASPAHAATNNPSTISTTPQTLSLANTGLYDDEPDYLWPIELKFSVRAAADPSADFEHTVSDGEVSTFAQIFRTPRGIREIKLTVTARHHIGNSVELEYGVKVFESRFVPMSVSDYVMLRLGIGSEPKLGEARLRTSRANLVTLHGQDQKRHHTVLVEIDGAPYEITINARNSRG